MIKFLKAKSSVSILSKRILFALLLFIGFGALSQNTNAQDFEITDPTQNIPQEYSILGVEVRGNEFTREQFIINASSLNSGSTIVYPGDDIPDAIKRLYNVGLFSDVKIFITERTSTGIRLVIEVTEQPRMLEYKIEGTKRSERKDLRDLIRLVPGTAITTANIEQAKSTILNFFEEKGLWFTEVTTRVEPSEIENRSILYFDVEKGDKLEVKDIQFEGAESFSDRKLRKKIKPLKEDAWWKFFSKKVFKEEDFEEGKESLISFYNENGYVDARIKSDSVWVFDYDGDKQGIKVRVNIEEGPQYKVRNITWDGNTVYTDEQLTEALGFEKGDIFDQQKYEMNISYNPKTSADINSLYQNIGYLFFQLNPNIRKVAEDSLDLHFDIYEDEIATIRRVSFTGNTNTHDDVVRRTLRTVPGNTYSQDAMIRSIRELSTLGYFDPQNITPIPQPIPQSKEVDITYELDESQSTSNFEFSGGYGGRAIGAIISARLNFNNFSLQRALEGDFTPFPSGDGQTLSLGVQVTGTGYQSYSFGFSEPWLNGKPTSLGVNLSYNFIRYRGFDETNRLFSASVSLGKRLKWPDDYFQTQSVVGYQLYDVTNASFLAEGTSNLITFKQILIRNSLDNPISPNSGSKFTLSGEIAPPLPGFTEFYKIKTDFQHHVPVVGKLVLTSQAEYGFIGYMTKDQRSNFQRFLVGGTQLQQRQSFLYDNIDMRGYPGGRGQSIAPFEDGVQVGGRVYGKYSLEVRYPAVNSEQLQLIPYMFADAGNAYADFASFDPFNLKRSVGFGARLFLPVLGLVDLSYGYRLDGIDGTDVTAGNWEFLFNIGAPF